MKIFYNPRAPDTRDPQVIKDALEWAETGSGPLTIGDVKPARGDGNKLPFQFLREADLLDPKKYEGTRMRFPKYKPPFEATPRGWMCPRCESVWAPTVHGCERCNGQHLSGEVKLVVTGPPDV